MSSSLLSLRSHYPFPLSHSAPKFLFKFSLSSSSSSCLSLSQTLTRTLTPAPSRSLAHGPSLPKTSIPIPNPNPSSDEDPFDRSQFSRTFDIAALRVPAASCSALEYRLRGHLLNWPRIRNIARVPGDDVYPDLKNLLRNPRAVSKDRLDSLERRVESEEEEAVFSPVLHREKLAKSFSCRGYLNFRTLARISRPKEKKRKKKGREERGERREIYAVEVVEVREEEDWSVLIGDGFRGGKWSGPTRLLLLDEQYSKRGMDEMSEAIKVALHFSAI